MGEGRGEGGRRRTRRRGKGKDHGRWRGQGERRTVVSLSVVLLLDVLLDLRSLRRLLHMLLVQRLDCLLELLGLCNVLDHRMQVIVVALELVAHVVALSALLQYLLKLALELELVVADRELQVAVGLVVPL